MDALEMLKRDHRKVQEILYGLQASLRNDTHLRRTLLIQLREELKMHEYLEEECFYPELQQHSATRSLVAEACKEHRMINQLVSELQKIDGHDDRWQVQLSSLQDYVAQHVKEEERRLFPAAKKALGYDRLVDLASELADMKDQVIA
jgi:hemerythrin superfamily protein